MEDPEELWEALARARIIADPRKFSGYVLVPGHASGKDRNFLGRLGFRARSAADAWDLARLYELQARERVGAGEVQFSRAIAYGVLCTIAVTVREASLRTVWLLDDDVLRLITPFSGFAGRTPKG